MSTKAIPVKDHPSWYDSQRGFTYYEHRVYRAGQDNTLVDLDLEEGDTVPGDSAFEIVSATIRVDPKTGDRLAFVVGVDERYR
uniref:Uncharacterized protein n=1 Tax=viral metagenome TaxID=1070528 RepID=A0A6M3L681_9ZZZZ